MSFLDTLRNHAGKLLAIGAIGAGIAYGHDEANDPGEELYRGDTSEGYVVYTEDVGRLEPPEGPFDLKLEKNVMTVEQDGKTYIIESREFENDLNLNNRQYKPDIPEKVIIETDDGREVYLKDGTSSGAVLNKANQVYNKVREEIKKELILEREFEEDMVADRDALVEQIEQRLDSLDHTHRPYTAYTEEFTPEKTDQLSLEELNQVNMILDGMQDEQTLQQLGELVNADFHDGEVTLDGITDWGREDSFTIPADSTEIGGLILKTEDGIEYTPTEPASAQNNEAYHLPIIRANIPAVAGFHLHAVNDSGDARYAGPSGSLTGSGDIAVSAARKRSGVVATYLGTDDQDNIQVNLDFYTVDTTDPSPEITVIDLGNYDTGVTFE